MILASAVASVGTALVPLARSSAQGCMPIRYTSPTLGTPNLEASRAQQWQIGVDYRWVHANRFYVGRDYAPDLAPGGQPSRINVHTVDLSVSYTITRRLSATIAIPFATGTHSRLQADGNRYQFSVTGLGDVSLSVRGWLLDPANPRGNAAIGLGIKAPTGQTDKLGTWHTASGTEPRPIDPSVQLGDGGWGAIVRGEGFRQVRSRTAVYAAGSYLINPRDHITTTFTTAFGVVAPVASTDEYSAHAGLTFDALPRRGVALSIGARMDGVPVKDLAGGADQSFRRPGYAVYVEPALAVRISRSPFSTRGSTISLSIPVRVAQNRKASLLEVANGRHGGGDFANFLVFAGLVKRL